MKITPEQAQELLKDKYEKYNHPGIYSISINDNLAYIGKSRNMAIRIANHVQEIENNKKSNKYIQLRRAKKAGCRISFDVLEILDLDDELISKEEAKLIRQFYPPLNMQVPLIDNPRFFEYNKRAKTVKFEEIAYGNLERHTRTS